MDLELEGILDYERPNTRRWVPIVAVVLPVTAFVIVAAWFIRAYVAPPMIAIPSPMALAASSQAVSTHSPAPVPDAAAEAAQAQAAAPVRAIEQPSHPPSMPVFASLNSSPTTGTSAIPPMPAAAPTWSEPLPPPAPPAPTAYADPAPDAHAALEPSEPINGPIPLPAHRPHVNLARALIGPVPLPRPRPAEANSARQVEQPVFDRHAIQ